VRVKNEPDLAEKVETLKEELKVTIFLARPEILLTRNTP
jgi:hypothetical protein